MDKNFKVRVTVGFCLFVVAIVSLYVFDSIPFKILYGFFALVSAVELASFFKRRRSFFLCVLAIIEVVFLACSSIFVTQIDVFHFWYVILGVPGYDIFAYLFGKLLGGKIFGKSKPFPYVSKNKTWEGTIFGIITSCSLVAILIAVRKTFATDWIYLFCGPLALIGDLFESFLKRKFDVKDSNEILIKNPFFKRLEMIVGGSSGHGGFLDRVDSTAFACTILLVAISAV